MNACAAFEPEATTTWPSFSPDEMLARVEVLLRRKPLSHAAEMSLHVGALELNLIKRCARFEGQEFDLQPTEYRVLELMMLHPGQVLTRTMIFEAVWGDGSIPVPISSTFT